MPRRNASEDEALTQPASAGIDGTTLTSRGPQDAISADESRVSSGLDLHCGHLADPASVNEARRLVASVYLREGYLAPEDVDQTGLPRDDVDPFYTHSTYFGVSYDPDLRNLIAVSRLVRFNPATGLGSFPMLAEMELDREFRETIGAADLSTWVEVGAMAKLPGATVQAPNLLYRCMWQRAVREGHATWLCAADHRVSRTLRNLFGEEIRPVGPRQHFMGSATDPMVMYPPTSADWLARQAVAGRDDDSIVAQLVRLALAFFLEGLEPHLFTELQLDRFKAGGVDLRQPPTLDLRGEEPVIDLREHTE